MDEDGAVMSDGGALVAAVSQVGAFPCLDPDEEDFASIEAEMQANGRLIAAAPDLLAACRAVLDNVDVEMGSCPMGRVGMLAEVRAAVGKATSPP